MTEIEEEEVNIKNILQKARKARQEQKKREKEKTDEFLKIVLEGISKNANSGVSSKVSIAMHDNGWEKKYPLANQEEVLQILKDRGFEASIKSKHPAFPDCDCGTRSPPCMDWLIVENTWNSSK